MPGTNGGAFESGRLIGGFARARSVSARILAELASG